MGRIVRRAMRGLRPTLWRVARAVQRLIELALHPGPRPLSRLDPHQRSLDGTVYDASRSDPEEPDPRRR